ncbi:hypothetical protein BDQ17DRAFT_1542851 [Cyathus striatus]|nr:hypothetical protein BDQ17DRAFT_1542851 [Cyathus striatus]
MDAWFLLSDKGWEKAKGAADSVSEQYVLSSLCMRIVKPLWPYKPHLNRTLHRPGRTSSPLPPLPPAVPQTPELQNPIDEVDQATRQCTSILARMRTLIKVLSFRLRLHFTLSWFFSSSPFVPSLFIVPSCSLSFPSHRSPTVVTVGLTLPSALLSFSPRILHLDSPVLLAFPHSPLPPFASSPLRLFPPSPPFFVSSLLTGSFMHLFTFTLTGPLSVFSPIFVPRALDF